MSNPYGEQSKSEGKLLDLRVEPLPMPRSQDHRIALVGCGAIGKTQLQAYREAGWNVVVLCSATLASAEAARDEFFPQAAVTTDYDSVLNDPQVTVVDLALHLNIRPDYVRRALLAGKHVLSQKPFVENLEQGVELARLAGQQGVTLAVNQNGRWAGHFRALRKLVSQDQIGELCAADFTVYWGHDEIFCDHVLGQDPDLILYDFAIHWFDLIAFLFADCKVRSVYAITGSRDGQLVKAPTLVSVLIDFGSVQATINLRASSRYTDTSGFEVVGSRGRIHFAGTSLGGERVEVVNDQGTGSVAVDPDWFPGALKGSMADLLCAIEDQRAPLASAESSLKGLALCFAALESAATGRPVDPAEVSTRFRAS
jgi:predicted dehydrogenase